MSMKIKIQPEILGDLIDSAGGIKEVEYALDMDEENILADVLESGSVNSDTLARIVKVLDISADDYFALVAT